MARAQRTRTRQRARMGQVVLEAPPQMGPSSRTFATERNPRARAPGLAWTATVTARIAARHSYFTLAHCLPFPRPPRVPRTQARSLAPWHRERPRAAVRPRAFVASSPRISPRPRAAASHERVQQQRRPLTPCFPACRSLLGARARAAARGSYEMHDTMVKMNVFAHAHRLDVRQKSTLSD